MIAHHPTRGFTLIETVAALVILAVAIPPMMWALRDSQVRRVTTVQASTARWLAVEKLEDIIADRHSTTRGYPWLVSGNYAAESPVTGNAGFDRAVTFNETGPDLVTPGAGYMTVTVTVSWTDATATARQLSIAAVLTDY